ncbi:MAG: XRE family transcriptional regulator [Deltaproteobacteria bacterium RIFOXYB12_FULL_58_9]|nr:MAG: XRE family transcriptional regulator [Deltaproteobacteria bacterium RIFOXYB12_FULL_58_9]
MSDGRSTGLAARLRAARERAGLSQAQVARLMGVQRPTISEIEAGRRKVGADEVGRLADMYNVSISWLVNDQPEVADPMVELAARELAKLKKEDLDTVLGLLKTLRKKGAGAK